MNKLLLLLSLPYPRDAKFTLVFRCNLKFHDLCYVVLFYNTVERTVSNGQRFWSTNCKYRNNLEISKDFNFFAALRIVYMRQIMQIALSARWEKNRPCFFPRLESSGAVYNGWIFKSNSMSWVTWKCTSAVQKKKTFWHP